MPLPDTNVIQVGQQVVFADYSGDFNPAADNSPIVGAHGDADIKVQLSMADVANGAGRESAKADLGANRPSLYDVQAAFEFVAANSGEVVALYWLPSNRSAASEGNVHSVGGADAGAPSGFGDLSELTKAATVIGNFICTDDATTVVQMKSVGIFVPTTRYGILLVVNESGGAIHSDDVECCVVFTENVNAQID